MKIKDGFLLREVAGSYVVIAAGDDALDFNSIITVNEIGALIWKKIEAGMTKDEIIADILKEYSVDKETADRDFEEFIDKLKSINVIID